MVEPSTLARHMLDAVRRKLATDSITRGPRGWPDLDELCIDIRMLAARAEVGCDPGPRAEHLAGVVVLALAALEAVIRPERTGAIRLPG